MIGRDVQNGGDMRRERGKRFKLKGRDFRHRNGVSTRVYLVRFCGERHAYVADEKGLFVCGFESRAYKRTRCGFAVRAGDGNERSAGKEIAEFEFASYPFAHAFCFDYERIIDGNARGENDDIGVSYKIFG